MELSTDTLIKNEKSDSIKENKRQRAVHVTR